MEGEGRSRGLPPLTEVIRSGEQKFMFEEEDREEIKAVKTEDNR